MTIPSQFFFLEINARLQVEHPVTEAVTGLDLVELQLRVAAGEPLPLTQDDVSLRGHAVEARLYAEDPANGFLPSTGRVVAYAEPEGVRVDSGIDVGVEVTSHYDPMLAKVIAHAPDRAAALDRLARALRELRVIGPTTNAAYLRALLARPEVRAGEMDTSLIERLGGDVAPPAPDAALGGLALVALLGTPSSDDPWDVRDAWRFAGPTQLHARLLAAAGEVEALARPDGDGGWDLDGARAWPEGDDFRLEDADGVSRAVEAYRDGNAVWLVDDGMPARFALVRDQAMRQLATGSLEAPMPGVVLEVRTEPGATVAEGDVLVVLESMKMELVIASPGDGVVDGVDVAVGDRVTQGQPLVVLAAEPEERA